MTTNPALIVEGLTRDEYHALMAYRVPYTCGTGPNPPGGAYRHGAYVATEARYLAVTLHALGWTSVSLHVEPDRWVVRHAG